MIKTSISIVIPAYNEEKVVYSTLRDVSSYLKKKFERYEIIVVDDGSTDQTIDEVRKINGVKLISDKINRGKGYAVRRGVLEAKGDLILFMDADNSTNITELNHFMDDIHLYDIVIGSRALTTSRIEVSQNKIKKWLGKMGNKLIKIILGLSVNDTRCGFKLYRNKIKKVYAKQKCWSWSFDDEILFLAKHEGFSIHESPVTWINNFDSQVRSMDYLTSIVELLKIRLRYSLNKY